MRSKLVMRGLLASVVAAMSLAVGCAPEIPSRSRTLGVANYEETFVIAQAVLARHFEIASADPSTGEIRSNPKIVEAPGERLIGNSPARQIATMTLVRSGGEVVAKLSIVQQRQGRDIRETVGQTDEPYSGVPRQTPAMLDGPHEAAQTDDWNTERYRHDVETRILDELYRELHPSPATQPN